MQLWQDLLVLGLMQGTFFLGVMSGSGKRFGTDLARQTSLQSLHERTGAPILPYLLDINCLLLDITPRGKLTCINVMDQSNNKQVM